MGSTTIRVKLKNVDAEIEQGKIGATPLITHTYPPAGIAAAYELFEQRRVWRFNFHKTDEVGRAVLWPNALIGKTFGQFYVCAGNET